MILPTWELIIAIIGVALIFDFTNGFHDAANSIATVVSTKVLSPRQAVAMAAFFNFVAAAGVGVAVASTISKIVQLTVVDVNVIPFVILAALVGAIVWNLITWYFGLPSSSSHAIVGGLIGAGVAVAGPAAIKWSVVQTTAIYMVVSPFIGLIVGFIFMSVIIALTRNVPRATGDTWAKRLQVVSSAAYSFSHGTNDAQKTMGIILPLLFSVGYFGLAADPNKLPVPLWVILIAHTAIALGTLCGGWKIVHTMGMKITRLKPISGFAAETAGTATVLSASIMGIPVSTTHVISSSIMGVGTAMGVNTVRWNVARTLVWAWILTIPISAVIGYATFTVIRTIIGY